MPPVPFDYSSIHTVYIEFSNAELNSKYCDAVQPDDLSAFFLDDTRQALAPHVINVIVGNIIKILADPFFNPVHVDRIPAMVDHCPLSWQSTKDHVIHDGFRDLCTVTKAFQQAVQDKTNLVVIRVITDNLIFPSDFKQGTNIDRIIMPFPPCPRVSPKTVVIAPPPFPLDPAALLPAGCDGSRFRVPHVDDDDNDDDDDDDARASLDLVRDPPHPTASVVCPPLVVLSDGVHDSPNPTLSVICPPSVVLSDGPFLPLASAASANLHGPPLAPVELQIHQLGADEHGNGPPSYSGGGADCCYPPRDSYDDDKPPPPSAADPRGDHRNYYKNNSYPESSRRQSNHYPESSGQQSNYYSDTDYNPPSDSYDDYTPPSTDSHGDGKHPSSYTDDGRGEAADARFSDDHSSYPDDEHSCYSYDPDEPPGETC